MPSTYSSRLRLELIANGEQSTTWGTTTNTNLGTLLEEAIAGVAVVSMTSDTNKTLTANNGSTDEARRAVLSVTSTVSLTTTRDVIVPTQTKLYVVFNNTTGGQSIRVIGATGTGVTVPNGKRAFVYHDGTNVVDAISALPSGVALNGTAISANGQSLITAANYAAMLSLIGAQPASAGLTVWAGLTPSANAQSLVTAANYAAMRALLGLVIGTNVQAYDADLATWAGLTPSANAQSLVTAADYAAMRTLLGLVIGTNVQAYDTQLANFAANTAITGTITSGTAAASGGSNGDIYLKYT